MSKFDQLRQRGLRSRRRAQFLLRSAVVVLTIVLGAYVVGNLTYMERHTAFAGRMR